MTDMDKMMIEKVADGRLRDAAHALLAQWKAYRESDLSQMNAHDILVRYELWNELDAALWEKPTAYNPDDRLREALEAIVDRAGERDIKWAGMTARDIAIAALTNEYPADAQPYSGEVNRGET